VALVSPEREIWTGEADVVDARTLEGDIGVMPGHEELFGVLVDGSVVRVTSDGQQSVSAMVSGGFLSVSDDEVSILPSAAELANEIDVAAARAALANPGSGDDAGVDPEVAERRARARLDAVGQEA
jgi:F-type H+-transporting ATPase subunit epsilon